MKTSTTSKLTTRDLVLIALFAAMTAVGAFMNIPTPTVPFSMQFFFCAYAGALLGAKRGALSQLLYVAVGLSGIPVFARGGGIGYVLQPSFGFLLGFIVCAYGIGWVLERFDSTRMSVMLAAIFSGMLLMYAVGVPYLYFIVNAMAAPGSEISFRTALAWGFTPFILLDSIKAIIAAVTSRAMLPILRRQGLVP